MATGADCGETYTGVQSKGLHWPPRLRRRGVAAPSTMFGGGKQKESCLVV